MESSIDRIGEWSKIKLDVIERYLKEWAAILGSEKQSWAERIYIDAFAGTGSNLDRETDEEVPGSVQLALNTLPSFHKYYFIEKTRKKYELLSQLCSSSSNKIEVIHGDSNNFLINSLLPYIADNKSCRAVLLMDPYGLHFSWEVIELAGKSNQIDLILNFPIMDAYRNAFVNDPHSLSEENRYRMDRAWGDPAWYDAVYLEPEPDLFSGYPEFKPHFKKNPTEQIMLEYRNRIRNIAHFKKVSIPYVSKTANGSQLFYLFLASQKDVAEKIMNYIVTKFGNSVS